MSYLGALRAGRVWVPGSRRQADPSSLMLPEERWQQTRSEFASAVELPVRGCERLNTLAEEQGELLQRLAAERDTRSQARLADGEIVVDADEREQEGRLRALIEPMLPEVDLPDLLIEVNRWTGFTEHLVRSPGTGDARAICRLSSTP